LVGTNDDFGGSQSNYYQEWPVQGGTTTSLNEEQQKLISSMNQQLNLSLGRTNNSRPEGQLQALVEHYQGEN
jgi:hypothetical protein